ncbi:MAG: hypothetical protein JOY82_09955 [Streptosporangiaceae bacterium]|nr:hypothetical protein [Streptosporangiaceae bacterium]MBV9854833.1 hypothetical protein [Streptosporangiaceae bacterium]
MLAAAATAAGASHPAVAAVLGLGAAGLAGGVVAMAWNVHAAQLRLAELLARRQAAVPAGNGAPVQNGTPVHVANGNGVPRPAVGEGWEQGGFPVETGPAAQHQGSAGREAGPPGREPGTARRQAGTGGRETAAARREAAGTGRETGRTPRAGPAPAVVIEGPDTVVIGERARYRVRHSGTQQVVSWAAGGGSVSQSADPVHPDELVLVADRPGSITVSVRVREGLTERREMKTVTAVPDPEAAVPRFVPRLFLQEWGLIAVAVLVVGFAGALVALGSLTSSDFIALAAPLAALLGVLAATRGSSGTPGLRPGGSNSGGRGADGYGAGRGGDAGGGDAGGGYAGYGGGAYAGYGTNGAVTRGR